MSSLSLFWLALELLGGLIVLFGGVIIAVCWPLWVFWGATFGLRFALAHLSEMLAALLALPVAWLFTLFLELLFWRHLFAPVSGTDGAGLFVATFALGHLALCTPWVVWDYARS